MTRLNSVGFATTLILGLITPLRSAEAQNLIFSLPDDGALVVYEGTLKQATSVDDENPLSWTCELSIKSVGKEDAMFDGQMQPCRWIEIKTLTGRAGAAGIDPGPVGLRIYKCLIPESKVYGTLQDESGIAVDMLPIVRGYRRIGEDAVKEIRSPALRTYPMITLLTNYQTVEEVASNAVPETLLQGQTLSARHMKGTTRMERAESRSTNAGEYWVSEEVPFGLARWSVTVTREEKPSAAPVSEFKVVTIETVDMKIRTIRQDAESELVTQ